ncbi:hypothetical protein AURANDRAFT_62871 [Aureococcus anophagefferens]|uniref:Uncharacterized protein n=1 Tax=Aureococcus anophagefferens TaxID=44056 RepID=F0Y3D2_AURAN|nr:hypothetical protein AURANDRAFT_62871 [Aureococcus anophagefferens]EGB10268.1 hypothetical protein AURANDRAFT_62871 [Aureococcus anophagefferens]|eukprot:XP_009035081.1 hypothetical protein AURANDRAFT_62871 [Aureococcus anophagefferens]
MRAAAVLVLAAAAAGQDSPSCFAKPADACANLLWATQNNKTMTMCLVPSPPAFLSKAEAARCCGLGLGCPGDFIEWAANGYDPAGSKSKLGDCYCDAGAGDCASGTIAKYYALCGCGDAAAAAS